MFNGQADFLHGAEALVDNTECHVVAEALLDHGSAVAPIGADVGKVDIATLFQPVPFVITEERTCETLRFLRGKRRMIGPNRRELSIAAPCRWVCGSEVEIGAFILATELQVFVNVIQDLVF